MAKKVYAVKKGRETGLFSTWEECKQKVHGYPGAQYKSFPTLKEAQDYLQGTINREMPEISPEEVCTAYVDGSFDQSRKAYSYGCILLYQGKRIEMSKAFFKGEDADMRNVAGELEGAMAAMAYCILSFEKSLAHFYTFSLI